MSPINLAPIVKDYPDKWVALSDDESTVLGVGDTAKEASQDAEAKGHLDYILFFVRPPEFLFCGKSPSLAL